MKAAGIALAAVILIELATPSSGAEWSPWQAAIEAGRTVRQSLTVAAGKMVHGGTIRKYRTTAADQLGDAGSLVAIARQSIGARRSPGWPSQWCGAWLASVARRAGYSVPANAALARSWAGAGVRMSPRPGVVMAMAHHVGIVIGVEGGRIVLLSGNHSGRVGIGSYPIGRALAFVALQ